MLESLLKATNILPHTKNLAIRFIHTVAKSIIIPDIFEFMENVSGIQISVETQFS